MVGGVGVKEELGLLLFTVNYISFKLFKIKNNLYIV